MHIPTLNPPNSTDSAMGSEPQIPLLHLIEEAYHQFKKSRVYENATAQNLLPLIVEFISDATVIVDQKHRVVAWNKAMEELTGIPKKEILGKGNFEYALPFYGHHRPILLDFIGKDTNSLYSLYDLRHCTPNSIIAEVLAPSLYNGRGALLWCQANPLYDEQKNIIGAIQTIRDVTTKKQDRTASRILHQIYSTIAGLTNEQTIMDKVFTILAEQLNISSAYAVIKGQDQKLHFFPFFREPTSSLSTMQHKSLAISLFKSILETNQPQKLSEHQDTHKNKTIQDAKIWLGHPIRNGQQVMGALVLCLESQATLLMNPDHSLLATIGNHLGQTLAHATALKTLVHNEKEYRLFFENSATGICQISLDCGLVNANPALAQILGYAHTDALMNDAPGFLYRLIPDSTRTNLMHQLLQNDKIENFIFSTVRQDNTQIWITANIHALRTSQGNIQLLNCFVEDITARRAAERDLDTQKNLFWQFFENFHQPIMLLGPNGTPTEINPCFTDFFGLTMEDEQALSEILIPPDNIETAYSFLTSILSGQSELHETQRPAKNGQIIPVSILGYPYLLDGQIAGAFLIFTDIAERKNYENKLSQMALRDNLTGLANRSLFMDRLDQAMQRKRSTGAYRFATLMIDLDGFKRINDTLGHQAGDHLLQKIAQRLTNSLRTTDTVARLGGDEFAVLLEGFQNNREAIIIIRRLLHDIRQPTRVMGQEITVSASMGVVLNTAPYDSPNELLRDTDISMYRSKEKGKNQFKIFSKSMYDQVVYSVQREQDIRNALLRNEFELYFQPIYTVKNLKLCGFEALIRWNHPTEGLLFPGSFLNNVASIGLEPDMGRWILRRGLQVLDSWNHHFPELNLYLSINLSSKDLAQSNLLSFVSDLIQTEKITTQLKLEITESAIIEDPEYAIAKLKQLKQLGLGVALDDFGTGYSSLSYLQRLPIDILKVDRSFISTMMENPSSLEIVRTIFGLGKILNKQCVAEGVETKAQLEALAGIGYDLCQGYLLGRPMPLKKVMQMLTALTRGQQVQSKPDPKQACGL